MLSESIGVIVRRSLVRRSLHKTSYTHKPSTSRSVHRHDHPTLRWLRKQMEGPSSLVSSKTFNGRSTKTRPSKMYALKYSLEPAVADTHTISNSATLSRPSRSKVSDHNQTRIVTCPDCVTTKIAPHSPFSHGLILLQLPIVRRRKRIMFVVHPLNNFQCPM